jgi:putative endonuclease
VYFVYILESEKDGSLYIGYTTNLEKRINEHKVGKALATKYKRPYKLVYYEMFLNQKDAKSREEYLKSGWGFRSIKKLLRNYFFRYSGVV